MVLVVVAVALGALASRRVGLEVLVLAGVLTHFVDIHFVDARFWWRGIGEFRALVIVFALCSILLWSIRRHLTQVTGLMAATVLLSTLFLPVRRADAHAAAADSGHRKDLPLLVHVVLDEHVGIEGLPSARSALRNDLQSFYQSHGFRVFGGAYSEHGGTHQSLGHVLNFEPGRFRADLTQPGNDGSHFKLLRNAYFDRLIESGYVVRVHQTDWLDFCAAANGVANCHVYSARGIAFLETSPLRVSERAVLIGRTYLDGSKLHNKLGDVYNAVSSQLAFSQFGLPSWTRMSIGAPNSLLEATRLIDELSRARRGEAFFAHLIAPHEPYVYDENCELLPMTRWRSKWNDAPSGSPTGDRSDLYVRYEAQVRCTMRIIQRIIDAIPGELQRDATIIVHGDHGSRLGLVQPEWPAAAAMSVDDYRDAYSTLFAARSSGLASAYDNRLASIACIFTTLVKNEFQSDGGLNGCQQTPAVFMRSLNGFVQKPFPAIAREAEQSPH